MPNLLALDLKTYAVVQRIVGVPAKILMGDELGVWSGFSLLLQAGGGFEAQGFFFRHELVRGETFVAYGETDRGVPLSYIEAGAERGDYVEGLVADVAGGGHGDSAGARARGFSFLKLSSEVKLSTSFSAVIPKVLLWSHAHMTVDDAGMCLPGSMGTRTTALISSGVRQGEERFGAHCR
jgi:hypothetical protein